MAHIFSLLLLEFFFHTSMGALFQADHPFEKMVNSMPTWLCVRDITKRDIQVLQSILHSDCYIISITSSNTYYSYCHYIIDTFVCFTV